MSSAINLQSLNFGPSAGIMEGTGGLQAYVDQSSVLTAVNGAPASGQFRSSIVNRASIPNITADLKASMGIERIMTQQIYEIPTEFGSGGERVFSVLNDDKGLMRFVGSWISVVDNDGQYVYTANTTDYIEITFYGTALNLVCRAATASQDMRASVDGGAEGSNIFAGVTFSSVLSSRNYSSNQIITVTSGLSLGLHTVKLRNNQSSQNQKIYGFEVLNTSASINVNPGSGFAQFKKNTLTSAASLVYNSSFAEILKDGAVTGTLGTRGARVLTYLDTDGSVKKKAVAVNSASANLTSADHTNEEVVRTYHFREFGANRSNDFSSASSSGNYAFTLDDGTTSLVGSSVFVTTLNGIYGVAYSAGGFLTLTFIGSGLDVVINSTSANTVAVTIDGTSVGNITTGTTGVKTYKVVSGLPYGTHTAKLSIASPSFIGVDNFIVYNPKKPSLPSGAIELADYNIMADYSIGSATGTASTDHVQKPVGVLSKYVNREMLYVGGSWAVNSTFEGDKPIGFSLYTSTTTQYMEYTFFGTGFVTHFDTTSSSPTFTVTIDGSLNSSGVARANATNSGSGVYTMTTNAGNGPVRVEFTGLTLGTHTVRFTLNAGAILECVGLDIITPIHSPKSNINADLQNTLPVGSCSLSDSRKLGVIKSENPGKAWAQAVGTTTSFTYNGSTYLPMPEMNLTLKTNGGKVAISYSICGSLDSVTPLFFALYVNGVQVGTIKQSSPGGGGSGQYTEVSDFMIMNLPAGTHSILLYSTPKGSLTAYMNTTARTLLAFEL